MYIIIGSERASERVGEDTRRFVWLAGRQEDLCTPLTFSLSFAVAWKQG